jgi:hypothetical protein
LIKPLAISDLIIINNKKIILFEVNKKVVRLFIKNINIGLDDEIKRGFRKFGKNNRNGQEEDVI